MKNRISTYIVLLTIFCSSAGIASSSCPQLAGIYHGKFGGYGGGSVIDIEIKQKGCVYTIKGSCADTGSYCEVESLVGKYQPLNDSIRRFMDEDHEATNWETSLATSGLFMISRTVYDHDGDGHDYIDVSQENIVLQSDNGNLKITSRFVRQIMKPDPTYDPVKVDVLEKVK